MTTEALVQNKPRKRETSWWIWWQAARPKTLWAAVSPVMVGTALAWRDNLFHPWAASAALLGALTLQVAANFANDLYDFERGADTEERLGPLRVTQAKLVTPGGMRWALGIVLGFAFAVGIFLVWRAGWPIVIVGLLSIGAAVLYSGGPLPYGYHALGDLFVFVFFGIIAVTGTYYVQALAVNATALLLSVPVGLLVMAILVVNNLRDIDTDRQSGKKTLAVILGRRGTRWEFVAILVVAALMPLLLIYLRLCGPGVLLASGVMLTTRPLVRTAFRNTQGPELNNLLAQTARLQLIYGLALAVGLNL